MKVKQLIEKLQHLPQDADAVIVIPKEAVPNGENMYNQFHSVAFHIHKVIISRNNGSFCEIGISV